MVTSDLTALANPKSLSIGRRRGQANRTKGSTLLKNGGLGSTLLRINRQYRTFDASGKRPSAARFGAMPRPDGASNCRLRRNANIGPRPISAPSIKVSEFAATSAGQSVKGRRTYAPHRTCEGGSGAARQREGATPQERAGAGDGPALSKLPVSPSRRCGVQERNGGRPCCRTRAGKIARFAYREAVCAAG